MLSFDSNCDSEEWEERLNFMANIGVVDVDGGAGLARPTGLGSARTCKERDEDFFSNGKESRHRLEPLRRWLITTGGTIDFLDEPLRPHLGKVVVGPA